MAAVSNPKQLPTREYTLRIITINIGGDVRFLFGEAVDLAGGEPAANTTATRTVPAMINPPTTTPIDVTLTTKPITRVELEALLREFEISCAQIDGVSLKTGRLVRREPTIVPVLHGVSDDDGSSLHPDGRHTYVLEELWDADEETLERVWGMRCFQEIGIAVRELVGVELHNVSERIGNFLVFDRLSSWRIDSQCDVRAPVRWIRAVSDDESATDLRLHVRILDGFETVTEQFVALPPQGVSISATDYTQVSFSLFDHQGRVLARSAGSVLSGPVTVSSGVTQFETVTDSAGMSCSVEWPPWPGGSPRRGIRADRPWASRAGGRFLRNLKQRERATMFTYSHESEAVVTDLLREIVSKQVSEFLYVWDPYLDADAVLDVLQWAHPAVPCKVLCGTPMSVARLTALRQALQTLRTAPVARAVECKHRVELRGVPPTPKVLYHDRFLITKAAAWMLGSSLNSIGRAPGSVIRLFDPDPLRWLFEDEWNASMSTTVTETML